jgi:hypothetical protein
MIILADQQKFSAAICDHTQLLGLSGIEQPQHLS